MSVQELKTHETMLFHIPKTATAIPDINVLVLWSLQTSFSISAVNFSLCLVFLFTSSKARRGRALGLSYHCSLPLGTTACQPGREATLAAPSSPAESRQRFKHPAMIWPRNTRECEFMRAQDGAVAQDSIRLKTSPTIDCLLPTQSNPLSGQLFPSSVVSTAHHMHISFL